MTSEATAPPVLKTTLTRTIADRIHHHRLVQLLVLSSFLHVTAQFVLQGAVLRNSLKFADEKHLKTFSAECIGALVREFIVLCELILM